MIYIVGFTFQFNPQSQPAATNLSIQERIVMVRHGNQKTTSAFDHRFVKGAHYKIAGICRIAENKESKFKYLFVNLNDSKQPDVDVVLPSTSAGDEYVAAISGNGNHLSETRKAISASLDSNRDH